jgi:hypothetical protein
MRKICRGISLYDLRQMNDQRRRSDVGERVNGSQLKFLE